MYSVLLENEDGDDEDFDEDEVFIRPPLDDRIEDKGAQTNKVKVKVTPIGGKGISEVQQSLKKSNNNKGNDAVLNLRGGNDDDNSAKQSKDRSKKRNSNRNLKVRIMGPLWTIRFSIFPVTKIAPQATRLREPSTGNCGYS